MQRQSLGSPSSKLLRDEHLSPEKQSSLSANLLYGSEECKQKLEDEELKKLKPKATMSQSYIHLIPMLTLLCFLILYLSSHTPSQTDLAQFNGVKTFSNPADSGENISELQRMVEVKRGDIVAIRSLKNLKQEAGAAKSRRLHRKFSHF